MKKRKSLVVLLLTMIFAVISVSATAQALTGEKTIGSGGHYTSFTAAINALNANGVGAGGVIFNVIAGAPFAERPPAITATGTEADQIVFQKSGTGANPVIIPTGTSASNEAGIIISGGDYITFDGIDINSSAVTTVEHGYLIRNASATNGAKYNTIKNFTVTLNRNNTTSAYGSGVLQSTDSTFGGGTNPTAQSGANDYNRYLNFSIQSSASGIVMYGGSYKDQYCEIGTTAGTIRNTLSNLGNTNGIYSYGIYVYKGAAFTISNCDVSAINGMGNSIIGINLVEYGLTSTVNNNSIRDLNNTGTSTSLNTIGLNTHHVYAGDGVLNIYNNTISDLRCASSGPTTTTKVIGVKLAFGESNEAINLFHNTISIGYGRSWDFRSAGVINFAISSDINMKGNIVANYATNTGASARSYCITAARKYLGDGETDYNLYYCKNGYLGSAEGWDAIDLEAWQSLVQLDKEANSVYGDPYLREPNTNLHGTGSKAIGQPGYTLPAYITVDMDYEARGVPTAIGADTYNPIDEDSAVLAPLTQVPAGDLIPVANTAQDALEVFRFRMSDSGGDGYATKITTVKIKRSYIWNYAELTTVLQGALLKVNGAAISTATAVITNEDITFTIPEGDLDIADGATVECGLFIYFKTSGIVDGKTLKFMITKDVHGFTNAFWGSRLPVTLADDIISNDFTINVTATQLRLIHPARELKDRLWSVTAEATDANGTIDRDYTGIGATLSLHTGTGVLGGTLQTNFNTGTCSWTISYHSYEWIKLQALSGSLSVVSSFIQINPYIEVSSGPIPGAEISWNTPFIYNFYYGRSVALYTNPEVNGYYSIEALSWNVASTLNTYYPLPVKIYMKAYPGTFSGLSSSTTWESLISGATLVYNGSTNAMNSTGWKKINLDSIYNNQSNPQSLLVFIESNQANYYHPTTPTFVGNYLNSQDYHYSGASGSSSMPSPFNVQKWQFRPHIRFWVTSQGYYEDTVTEQSSTATVSANATNQQIIRVNVQTGGSLSQQTINSLTFNTTGTTDVGDITAARVFYTGASATFSTTTQYGSTVTNLGSKGAFTVSSNINVSSGNHYFWLVYDIGANPSVGDQFDAQCTAVSVNNISRIPSVTNPAGSRGVAGKKLSDVWVSQLGQGTTSSGAQNIGILKIDLYVTTGSDAQSFASLPLNSISITGKNTNNADVQTVKLANQTNPSSFLGTASMATGTALLSNLNHELQIGTNSVYVYYDISPDAGAGNIVDAKIIANSINVAGITHPAAELDPSGEYTIQNFNYGGGYAEQGGYYFANTLADPAPSHPTFSWIDISTGGYNSFADMSGDDGIADRK
ncbi:MAG: BNR-repeat neuraminidase N-terminal domain-containing protein, partial [Candidatus Cloacimonetes bacterium]|nr:BNR-repeat neuraminidase N-terminal domain-containing protein [Candidatus Cloacimonadota bacterium]